MSRLRLAFFVLLALLAMVATVVAFSGRGTWFNVGLGACGQYNNNNQLVAALNSAQYSNGAYCGKQAIVNGPNGQVQVTIVDECPGCGYGSLDLSPAAFSRLANLNAGDIPTSWNWA